MGLYSRVVAVELIGPTSIGFRLEDGPRGETSDQIVVSPVHFIADFSVFLTAVRAGGETGPVDRRLLRQSWEEAREALRRRLVDEDPWGEQPAPAPGEESVVALGEEHFNALRDKQVRERGSSLDPPSGAT